MSATPHLLAWWQRMQNLLYGSESYACTACVTFTRPVLPAVGPEVLELVVQDQKDAKQVSASDLAWMGDYQSVESLFSHSLLPPNHPSTLFSRVFR